LRLIQFEFIPSLGFERLLQVWQLIDVITSFPSSFSSISTE